MAALANTAQRKPKACRTTRILFFGHMSTLPPTANSASSDVEQAAWWLAQMHSDEPWSPEQQQALDQWLGAQPSHVQVFERMQQMWGAFESANAPAARIALQAGTEAATQRRNSLRATTKSLAQSSAVVLATWLSWLGWQHEQTQYWAAEYRSGKGEIITIALPDQSQITLGSNSAVNVHYDQRQRRLDLVRGDLMAVVAPAGVAQPWPFIVQTPNASAQALGTVYSVRYRQDMDSALWSAQGASTLVAVQESTVRACLPSSQAPAVCQTVQAGQFTRIDAQGLHPVEAIAATVAASAAPAWTRGQLVIDNQPLPQVLNELARHRAGWLLFDAQALADIRVSGVFDLTDTDRSLQALRQSTDIAFQSTTPWVTQVVRKAASNAAGPSAPAP